MWNHTRRGRSIIRKRRDNRDYTGLKKRIYLLIILPLVVMVGLGIMFLVQTSKNEESLAYMDTSSKKVNIYVEPYKEKPVVASTQQNKSHKNTIKLTVLGEIMMGGKVVKPQSGSYTSAFSTLGEYVEDSDYVVANLTTNITDEKAITNAKYKYLVTNKILNAFNALNINAVNIANDHALDFGIAGIEKTKSILQKDNIKIVGLKNEIVYEEIEGVKVAILSMCNQVIEKQYNFEKANLSMYNLSRIEKNIRTAKKNADIVIVMNHLGNELSNRITSIMGWQYKKEIEYGADIVLGSHALGMYPVEIYNGKPIIYSLGYLIHDTSIELGKESGIFSFNISENGIIESIEIVPTYIENKERTINYYEYNSQRAEKLLKLLSSNIPIENKIIEKDRLFIKFN